MESTIDHPLKTRRIVIGQMTVCSGCCCGNVNRGKPEVPIDWLKQEWRARGLLKNVQLTISCCMGPCDLPNVVRISGAARDIWLGGITAFQQYSSLIEWASQSKSAGVFLPLPAPLVELQFDPFQRAKEARDV